MTPFDFFRDYATIMDYKKLACRFKGKTISISKNRLMYFNLIFRRSVKFYSVIIRLNNLIIEKLKKDAFCLPYF